MTQPLGLDNRSLSERAFSRLRDELVSPEGLPLGARLDERELAGAMGISRTPLREAIGMLVQEGLVERRPYQGNFVRTLSVKEVDDLYEVRKALEALATKRAVVSLTDADVLQLRSILDAAADALSREDIEAFAEADRAFHAKIAQLAGNETLTRALDGLDAQIRLVRRVANRDPTLVARTTAERERMLDALRRRDAAGAARLMEEHIEGVRLAAVAALGASGAGMPASR